jgi:hypothetical protein
MWRRLVTPLDAQRTRRLERGVFLFPLVFIVGWVAVKLAFPARYVVLVEEDGFVENVEAFLCVLASVFAARLALGFVRSGHRLLALLYAGLAVVSLFVAGEEISWGQRLLGLPVSPYFAAHNTQGELTIHNLEPVQRHVGKAYILLGLAGAFSWALARRRFAAADRLQLRYLVPDWFFTFYFLPVSVVYLYFSRISPFLADRLDLEAFRMENFVIYRDQEPAELLLYLGIFLFVLAATYRQARAARTETRGRASAGR